MSDKQSLRFHLMIGQGYSVFGSLGFLFFIEWWFGLLSWSRYPRFTAFAIITGLACLALCIALLILHIMLVLKKPRPKYWLLEIPVVLVAFIPMLFVQGWLVDQLRDIF